MSSEPLGAMLVRLREDKGYLQQQVAEELCRLSETPTVTRHEVSRWERELRVPSDFWLGWLSRVFEMPMAELEMARGRSRKEAAGTAANEATVVGGARGTRLRERARPRSDNGLALVALKFEHRATSVQFNGTYEVPEQATAAIGMFRELVAPGTDVPVNGRSGEASVARQSGMPVAVTGTARTPTPAGAAVRSDRTVRVPMGIRYTSGPGVAADGSNQASANGKSSTENETRRKP